MPRTRGILPQTRAFAFVDVKSHDSVAKGTLLHLMVASHATARLIARRCSLDTRSQWPASPIAATVTRDVGRATRHNTQAPRHRLRCTVCAAPTPFALSPFAASYPGARVITRTPGETRENSTRTNSRRTRIVHRNFRSRDRTTVEVRRLVCEVTWRWVSEVMREQEGRERKGETGRGSWRMEEVLVDGVGGRCSSEGTSTTFAVGGMQILFSLRRARTRFPVLTRGEYESPFCELKARLHFPLAKSVIHICGEYRNIAPTIRVDSQIDRRAEWHDERHFKREKFAYDRWRGKNPR